VGPLFFCADEGAMLGNDITQNTQPIALEK
jgi:hypothetical protein